MVEVTDNEGDIVRVAPKYRCDREKKEGERLLYVA
jgi:hypothetical protein